jgi:hypothetical protein
MAILLCVEGNTSLIVWNSVVQGLKGIWSLELDEYSDPGAGFNDTTDLLSHLNETMWTINSRFTGAYWNTTYSWQRNFTAIENYTSTYGFRSSEWNDRTGSLIRYMFDNAQVFVFEAHTETTAKLNAVSASTRDPQTRLDRVYDVFNTTVMQFYIGGGAFLLVLAVMYWFNKLHKTKYEFGEMINRVIAGFALIVVGVATVIGDRTTTGFKFAGSNWIIPIVVLTFAAGKPHAIVRRSCDANRYQFSSWTISSLFSHIVYHATIIVFHITVFTPVILITHTTLTTPTTYSILAAHGAHPP